VADRRVLVLGDYPVAYANGIGETLANLFAGHPDEDLFQTYPSHLLPLPGHSRGRAHPFEAPRRPGWWPGAAAPLYQPVLKVRQMAAARRLFKIAEAVIREQGINAVLTYPVTPWVLFAAVRLRRAFPDVRFVFYVMDDWEGHHTCFGLPFTAKRRRALQDMVQTSTVRFACSHLMKDDYEPRFGNAWNVLHKGVDVADLPGAAPRAPITNILYTGGMNVFRFDAVVAFVKGMKLARARAGVNLTLTLLGPEPEGYYREALAPFDFIRTEQWVDNAACQRRMAEFDALYLPLSFESRLDRIARLAMPTKFSEYLASGRPTILHVPHAAEVQRLADSVELPLTLNTLDPNAIADALIGLHREDIDRRAYQQKAERLLRAEFDQQVLRDRLQAALFGAAREGLSPA